MSVSRIAVLSPVQVTGAACPLHVRATSSNPTIGFEFRFADWLFSTPPPPPPPLCSSGTLLRTPYASVIVCCLNERCSRYAHPWPSIRPQSTRTRREPTALAHSSWRGSRGAGDGGGSKQDALDRIRNVPSPELELVLAAGRWPPLGGGAAATYAQCPPHTARQ